MRDWFSSAEPLIVPNVNHSAARVRERFVEVAHQLQAQEFRFAHVVGVRDDLIELEDPLVGVDGGDLSDLARLAQVRGLFFAVHGEAERDERDARRIRVARHCTRGQDEERFTADEGKLVRVEREIGFRRMRPERIGERFCVGDSSLGGGWKELLPGRSIGSGSCGSPSIQPRSCAYAPYAAEKTRNPPISIRVRRGVNTGQALVGECVSPPRSGRSVRPSVR